MTGSTLQLHDLRRFEVERALEFVATRGTLLEIGAGDGFQADILAQHFDHVEAIDLAPLRPASERMFDVKTYDGIHLPFADGSFDVVFSSNVLEHIPHVEQFQNEIRRVLRRGGVAAHIMPSASWRFWSIVTHYVDLPARALQRLGGPAPARCLPGSAPAVSPAGNWRQRLVNGALERRHGERGTTLSELYLFSRKAWGDLFRRCGFRVELVQPLGLFYTGYSAAGGRLDNAKRQALARLLGSATTLYLVRPR